MAALDRALAISLRYPGQLILEKEMKFERVENTKFPVSRKKMIREFQKHGVSKKQAMDQIRQIQKQEVWANDEFTVHIDRDCPNGFNLGMTELSIKRNDKEPIMDWRKLQQIKNALVGEENDALQLFPAESRLVDTANQYYIFVFNDPQVRVPFGFTFRHVDDSKDFLGSKQRKFEE
ncbi:MAG: DUF7694 domain-containing protein [Planctomycetota bacterium]|jgi:hypothetical protein